MCTDPGGGRPARSGQRDHRRVSLIPPVSTSASELSGAVAQLSRLVERIVDAAVIARGLADTVDWQATAATTFHDRATAWAGEVTGLAALAESARRDAQRACDRAMFAESLPGGVGGGSR